MLQDFCDDVDSEGERRWSTEIKWDSGGVHLKKLPQDLGGPVCSADHIHPKTPGVKWIYWFFCVSNFHSTFVVLWVRGSNKGTIITMADVRYFSVSHEVMWWCAWNDSDRIGSTDCKAGKQEQLVFGYYCLSVQVKRRIAQVANARND